MASGSLQTLPTHLAGARQLGPLLAVLHAAPSAAVTWQFPPRSASQLPLAGQRVNLLGVIESAPHEPLDDDATASAMHLLLLVLHPTAWATSQSLCDWHVSFTCPATGVTQVDPPVGHAKPVLHD